MLGRFHPYRRRAAEPAPSGSVDELRSHLLARAAHLGSPAGCAASTSPQSPGQRATVTWQGPGLALYHRHSPELWLVEDNTTRDIRPRFLLTGHGRWDLYSLQELSQYGRYRVILHSHAGAHEAWKSDLDLYERLGAAERQRLRLPHLEIRGEAPQHRPARLVEAPGSTQCADVLAQLKLVYNVRSLNAATHEWAHYTSSDLAVSDLPGPAHRECAALVALELSALVAASRAWRYEADTRPSGAPAKAVSKKLVHSSVRAVVTDTVINTFCERSLTLMAPALDHLDAHDFIQTSERCLQFLLDRGARNAVVWFNLDKGFAAVRYSIPLDSPTRRAPADAKPPPECFPGQKDE